MNTAVSPAPFVPDLKQVPPVSLPLRHFVFAAASFWIFSAAFTVGAPNLVGFGFKAKWVLGLVHMLTLGWVTMTILGVMVQMTTVLWNVPLYSARAAGRAWWLFAFGIAGFVAELWRGGDRYWAPALLLASAVAIYLYVLVRTLLARKELELTGKHLAIALGYFGLLTFLAVMLAFDRQTGTLFDDPEGALIAHIHLALVGWVSITIFGASYKLVSMFALAHVDSQRWSKISLALVNTGLIGLVLDCLFFGRKQMPLWSTILALSFLTYVFQIATIFKAKIRKLDPSLAFTLVAVAGGLGWTAMGVGLAYGWIVDSLEARTAYISLALFGWVTPYILGQSYKIVPFLVWLHLYNPKNWKPNMKLPRIQDLSSEKAAWLQIASLVPAAALLPIGFLKESEGLVRAGAILLFVTATLYLSNVGFTLRELLRKDRA